jgi:hypothetical protein
MSDADPEPVDTTDAEDAEILLADPDDYHQTQRLREIHEARRNVHKSLRGKDIEPHEIQYAVAAYGVELQPLMRKVEFNTDLPDTLPWDDIDAYLDRFGGHNEPTNYVNYHTFVFRRLNALLADVKPLLEEDDTDEWEV